MDKRTDSGEFYPGGDRRGGDPIDLTFDDAVTRTSARAVKSSGIWAAVWGALAAVPTGFASLYDWCVAQLAGKQDALSNAQLANIEDVANKADASVVDAALAAVGDGYTPWSVTPAVTPGGDAIWLTYQGGGWIPMAGDPAMPVGAPKAASEDALALSWAAGTEAAYNITATRSRTATWTLANGKLGKGGGTMTGTLNVGDTPDATEITPEGGVTTPMLDARAAVISLVRFETRDAGGTLALTTPGTTSNAVLIPLQTEVGSPPKTVAFVGDVAAAADLRYRIAEAAPAGAALPEGVVVWVDGASQDIDVQRTTYQWEGYCQPANVTLVWYGDGGYASADTDRTVEFRIGQSVIDPPSLVLVYELADRAVTALPEGVSSVRLVFPPAVEGRARDFKALIPGSPRVEFAGPGSVVGRSGSATPQFVEYVEATGTQYIDTGVVGKAGIKADIDFIKLDDGNNRCLLGSRRNKSTERAFLCYFYKDTATGDRMTIGYGARYARISWPYNKDTRYSLQSEFTMAGTVKATRDGKSKPDEETDEIIDTGYPLYLFAINDNGEPLEACSARCYGLKLWQDGILVRDFRPCAVDGRGALYDAVSGSVFRSKTTPLLAGPAVSGESALYSFTEVRSGALFCREDHFKEVQ